MSFARGVRGSTGFQYLLLRMLSKTRRVKSRQFIDWGPISSVSVLNHQHTFTSSKSQFFFLTLHYSAELSKDLIVIMTNITRISIISISTYLQNIVHTKIILYLHSSGVFYLQCCNMASLTTEKCERYRKSVFYKYNFLGKTIAKEKQSVKCTRLTQKLPETKEHLFN